MPFQLSWGSVPSIQASAIAIGAEGPGFSLPQIPFGTSGSVLTYDPNVQLPAGRNLFDFTLYLFGAGTRLDVLFTGIGIDDLLCVMAVLPNTFLGSFLHQTPGVVGRTCTITCPDKTQGQGCIVCRDPPLVIKVCC